MFPHCVLPNGLSELFLQVTTTQKITIADRYGLMAVLCNESTSEEEIQAVDRILYALRQGRVHLVADLSNVS